MYQPHSIRRVLAIVSIVVVACAAGSAGNAQPILNAVPSEKEQSRATETIRDLLGDVLSPTTPEEARVSAARLAEIARGTDDDPAAQYVLFGHALDFAIMAGDVELALEIEFSLFARFSGDHLSSRLKTLRKLLNATPDVAATDAFRTATEHLVDNAIRVNRFEIAREAADLLESSAGAHENVLETLDQHRYNIKEIAKYAEEAKSAALMVLQHPDDPVANGIVGRYLCLLKGDWRTGLPHLAKSDDMELRILAAQEAAAASDARKMVARGDAWREYAATLEGVMRRSALRHAEDLYRKAYPEISGLTRLKLERNMRSRAMISFDADNPPLQAWVDEYFAFSANHGREGSGSWANYGVEDGEGCWWPTRPATCRRWIRIRWRM